MKQIKFDFYKVETHANDGPFAGVLNKVRQLPHNEARNVQQQGTAIRMSEMHDWYHGVEGDLIRIRMDDLPVKASLNGVISSLELDDDEGIGDQTAFFFHPETSVLVLQRNRHGVSDSAFCYYFEQVLRVNSPLFLNPIIHPDALMRMRQLGSVRKFIIRLAGINNAEFLRGANVGLTDIPAIMAEFESPSLMLELSMGHRRGEMNRNRVFAACRELFRVSRVTTTIRKLEITGSTDDQDKMVLDLIEDRFVMTRDLDAGENRVIDYETRRNAVRSVWHDNEQYLRGLLAGDGND